MATAGGIADDSAHDSRMIQMTNATPPTDLHEVTSEIAYDLLQDHMETLLSLLNQPMDRSELIERLGGEKTLARMMRQGLVEIDALGETCHAVSSIYHQMRQEGMMTFLERYVLPAMTASIEAPDSDADNGFATLQNLYLRLQPDEMKALRAGAVQDLVNSLAEITDRPASGIPSRLIVLVVGTSHLLPADAHCEIDSDRALKQLQLASVQRSTAEDRDLALLTQVAGLADPSRYGAAMASLDDFISRFADKRASSSEEANYHLTVASHWRSANSLAAANAVATDGEQVRATC